MRYATKRLTASIRLPAATGHQKSVLAFSIWKAGSTLLYTLLRETCPHVGLTYFGIDEELLVQNRAERPLDLGSVFLAIGYCYGSFRCLPHYPVPLLDSAKTVLLVRDPRDMLVSLYFSVRESHTIPDGEGGPAEMLKAQRKLALAMPIDDWISRNYGTILHSFEGYFVQGFPRRSNVAIYRYEDVIFRKAEWLADMASWFGWKVSPDLISEIATRHDILPEVERTDNHVRQVRPGNFKSHLSDETIARIESLFRPYMQAFDY